METIIQMSKIMGIEVSTKELQKSINWLVLKQKKKLHDYQIALNIQNIKIYYLL